MLQTFFVPKIRGRVRFISDNLPGHITIECYDRKIAFSMKYSGVPTFRVSDSVFVEGDIRLKFNTRGELKESNLVYFHDPLDGSHIKEWIHFELLRPEITRRPPATAEATMLALQPCLDGHHYAWDECRNMPDLTKTADLLATMLVIINNEMKKVAQDNAPVKSLDLSF